MAVKTIRSSHNPEYFELSALSVPISGSTVYGYYDNDPSFQVEGISNIKYSVLKLGYPTMELEIARIQLYMAAEQAVNKYGAIVNEYNIVDNYLDLQGVDNTTNLTQREISPSLNRIVTISKAYGVQAGSGGNVDYEKGFFMTEADKQIYDIESLLYKTLRGRHIEIRRVFHGKRYSSGFYEPYIGTSARYGLESFGWSNFAPKATYMMMPLYDDLLRMQEIGMHNTIRKSGYSFKIVNNKIEVFPIPTGEFPVWIEYTFEDESSDPLKTNENIGSDASNINYGPMTFSKINSVGREWIREMTYILIKKILGTNRSKYTSGIPYGNETVTLDGELMRQEAQQEEDQHVEKLRLFLEETRKKMQLENKRMEAENLSNTLSYVPLKIFIG